MKVFSLRVAALSFNMLNDTDVDDHYDPSIRLIDIERNGSANCGFHLTRGKWDPYPWVCSVEEGTAACTAGLKPGDCLLEVNGEDVIGRRVSEVAEIVKSKPDQVSLLLWNAGVDPQCSPEAVCCGPMPMNLQRLSACMSSILAFLECPVCLDTIAPPTYQCDNGHLICIRCRIKTERCPVCRLRFGRGRSLLSDQVYNALVDAFNLKDEMKTAKIKQIFKLKVKERTKNTPDIKITQSHADKFLERLVGKATSVDNLSTGHNKTTHLKTKSLSSTEIFDMSPLNSRASSMTRLSRNEKNKNSMSNPDRSASCHGSFESLLKTDFTASDDNVLYHCPFRSSCTSLLKSKNIIKHFQLSHEGPLVQYFQSNMKISLRKILNHRSLCYVLHVDADTFFVNFEHNVQHFEPKSSENVLLWTWFLGDSKSSKKFDMHVKVTSPSGHIILSVQNRVSSLSSTSYEDIRECKKAVFLSIDTLDNLTSTTRNDIILDITISKNDSD